MHEQIFWEKMSKATAVNGKWQLHLVKEFCSNRDMITAEIQRIVDICSSENARLGKY